MKLDRETLTWLLWQCYRDHGAYYTWRAWARWYLADSRSVPLPRVRVPQRRAPVAEEIDTQVISADTERHISEDVARLKLITDNGERGG